jgi:UDP-N-acetylmuramoyl-tripeptide--D-alanyl-D-alanine ligase
MATGTEHAASFRGSARRPGRAALGGRFTLGELCDATGARLVQGDPELAIAGVSTDTRTLRPGELFLALSGPNFDGNRFAAPAAAAGAAALLLSPQEGALPAHLPAHVGLVEHADPRRALGDLGAWYRSTLDATVLGVTGSSGKTTTKNILHALFSRLFPVVASPSSFNNDIGVPHTLLLADETTRLLVVEMGTNHPGEIAALCRIARPEIGIITNVGASHLAGLGSLEGVAREKGYLAEALPREGLLVLNAGSRQRAELAGRTRANVLTFSVEGTGSERGDLDARELYFHSGGTTFKLEGQEVTSPLLGTHNVENLLAALCVARGMGVALEQLLPAVSTLRPARARMERVELGGVTLFDDCYNANPQSLRAAVRVLAGLHGHGRRVLVMGDMLELGELSAELHHAIGREAAAAGVDAIVFVGTYVKAAASGALEGGLGADALVHFATTEEAAAGTAELVRAGDVVLVKGSRGMALERVVAAIKARLGERSVDGA